MTEYIAYERLNDDNDDRFKMTDGDDRFTVTYIIEYYR